MTDLPSGTLTLLFTDIEGSTRLLERLGRDRYGDALGRHNRLMREAFLAHGGVEKSTQGDSFFCVFAAARDAIAAAFDAQRSLGSHAWPDGADFRVRMGLHTGDLLFTDDYVGMDVHLAARIMSAGHGGQVLLSHTTRDHLNDGLPAGVSLRDLGEHRLKDFEEAVWIFQLGQERFPPLKTISNTNLPRPASSFVGREREVEEISALLKDGARLLTLTGPGGSGKTRLAIEAAAELVPEFRSGVFWVGLAALRDPTLVLESVAQTLGAKDGLAEHVGGRELLLLLDNLEQVVEVAPELSSLLSACPSLRLLVTSRELLRIQGEVAYAVPPLAEPDAVKLLCARCQLEPDGIVAELCRALDNLPLALELAAARASVLSPEQILERLSKRLDLLKGGRDSDPRQATLRATIEWSFDLLSNEEKALFARLAVFVGGCTLAAAEEVADAALDTLQSLVDKSLLRYSEERFWMLETIREYAAERLEASGEAEQVRIAHAEHIRVLAESARPHLRGSEQEDWLRRVEGERGNVRAALGWALDGGREELALEIATALGRFWWVRGPAEGLAWLEQALARVTTAPEVRAAALEAAGGAAWFIGDHERALHMFEQGLAIFRELGDRAGSAMMLTRLGPPLEAAGRADEAEAVVKESLAIHRELGDEGEAALALHLLGAFASERGDLRESSAHLEESITLARKLNDSWLLEAGLLNLAEIALEVGDPARAGALGREGLTVARAIGDGMQTAAGLCLLSITAARRGDPTLAGTLWEAAEQLERELGETLLRRDRAHFEELLGETGPEFERGREKGRALSLDEAMAHALEDAEESA